MKDKIILIGGGGYCHSVIDVIEQENKYEIIGIIDKNELFKICQNAVISVGQIESSNLRNKIFNNLKE